MNKTSNSNKGMSLNTNSNSNSSPKSNASSSSKSNDSSSSRTNVSSSKGLGLNMSNGNGNINNSKKVSSYKDIKLLNSIKSYMNNKNISEGKGIGERVRSFIEDEYNFFAICILLILLFILVIILYKNTFGKVEQRTLNKVSYYKELKINPKLNTCSLLEKTQQYRLADYYIASSYNTPCIGKPHFDYVSEEMYGKVLNSGARYIQVPICSKSVEYDTIPVVGTAQHGKSLITSLNYLDLHKVFSTIRSNAFRYVKSYNMDINNKEELGYGSLNYPLFIHLKIHTNNDLVLDKAYDIINDILGGYILNNEKYHNFPLSLEKLCNLTNKIIIISENGYESSKLSNLVIPTKYCFRFYNIEELQNDSTLELNSDQVEDYYKRSISYINQKNNYKNLEKIKKNIIDILDNPDNKSSSNKILENLFNENNLKFGKNKDNIFKNNVGKDDLFIMYNMIGLTLVEPMVPDASITNNVNPYIAFNNGCQFIAMNYHLNNDIMFNYINIFRKNSFILKPSGLRIGLTDENVVDLLDEYNISKMNVIKLNIIPNFVYTLENEFILLEEMITSNNKILSHSNTGIINFNKLNKKSNGKYDNITSNNVFKVVSSKLSKLNDCVHLVTENNLAITINNNFENSDGNVNDLKVYLSPLAKNLSDLQYQTFYPEEGLINSDVNNENNVLNTEGKSFVSFRVYNPVLENKYNNKQQSSNEKKGNNDGGNGSGKIDINNWNEYYLGYEKNILKLLPRNNDNLVMSTFTYTKMKTKIMIQLEHMNFGGVVVNNRLNLLYVSKNKGLNNSSKIEAFNYKGNLVKKDNYSLMKPVILRTNKGKQLNILNGVIKLEEDLTIDKSNIFLIGKDSEKDEQVVILSYDGLVLSCNEKGILEFKKDIGNNLGIQKYFNIKYTFNNFE